MTTVPRWEAVAADTADLLSLLAEQHPAVGADVPALFLAACKADADAHDGIVSVNRVRTALLDADIPPRRLSSLWGHYTGHGRPMVRTGEWEVCRGSWSRNDGRPMPLRRWVGAS